MYQKVHQEHNSRYNKSLLKPNKIRWQGILIAIKYNQLFIIKKLRREIVKDSIFYREETLGESF